MGTSASENIAIQISTLYDGAGINDAKKDLGALATAGKGATGALADASKINVAIGAFEAMGKKIDLTNANAIAGYRAQGDALAVNLAKLGATDAELNTIATAIQKVERSAGQSLLAPNSPQAQQLQKIPGQVKTAASALTILGQAAATGTGSMSGLANAVGNVATSLASMSNSARIAAGATGIGALLTVGSAIIGGWEAWRHTTRELDNQLKGLQSTGRSLGDTLGGRDLDARIEQLRQAAAQERQRLEDVGLFEKALGLVTDVREKARLAQLGQVNANLEKQIALVKEQKANEDEARTSERSRLLETNALQRNLEEDRASRRKSDFELQAIALADEQKQRDAEIRQSFVRRSDSGAMIALNATELAQLNKLLEINNAISDAKRTQLLTERTLQAEQARADRLSGSDQPFEALTGRLKQIEIERNAQIQSTGDVAEANANAEQKKRQLLRETVRQSEAGAKTLFEAFRSSSDKTLKAIGTFGDTLRRISIGARAAEAAVEAAKQTGFALASAAEGDLVGAGLHTAAALQLGAAAALGFRESLGGGGSGGAGGGGGAPTFQPRDTGGGGGNVTVVINTVDPTNKEVIRTVSYHLQRQGTLKTPIYSVSTPGFLLGVA